MTTPARQRFLARCALAAFGALCIGWLARLDFARKISTDVLDLIPPAAQSPELGLIRSIAGDLQARVILVSVRNPATPGVPPLAAARLLAAGLARSPAIAEATVLGEGDGTEALARELFDRRLELLLPTWLGARSREFAGTGKPDRDFSRWLASRCASDLQAFLSRPEAPVLQDLLPSDPILLLPGVMARAAAIEPPGSRAGDSALVWARIAASPFSEEGQGPVFAAIDREASRLRAASPGIEVRWTGINRFAGESRARIEREVKLINLFSVGAVIAIGCLLVRRAWRMIHLAPVILFSLLGAWTVSTALFARLHILVFVIGSLLSGVSVDYGFYIFMQPPLFPGEPYAERLRRLLKPLLASCLTTVIGFSLLLFSDLPLIRQVGLFVAAGLICALGAAMLYFAQLQSPCLEARGGPPAPRPPRGRPALFAAGVILAAVAAVAACGAGRLRWSDDVRELEIASPRLQANDRDLRALFGDTPGRSIYFTYGRDVADARRHLDAFLSYEAGAAPGARSASLGLIFPTEEDWRAMPARLDRLGGFEADFRAALDREGFIPGAFDPFFAAWKAALRARIPGAYADLYRDAGRSLRGPLAQLYKPVGSPSWFVTIVDGPAGPLPPAALQTVGANQLETLDRLFVRYRWSALRLSLLGLGLVIASVLVIYPLRRGLRIALIPSGSCFVVLGILGVLGQPLNVFNLLGAFLGVCLSHNYSIFSSESSLSGSSPPPPVRLSALCAAASFGVLACSRIPVVHSLGMTVALIVLVALSAIELEWLFHGGDRSS
jgi:predicted exporter